MKCEIFCQVNNVPFHLLLITCYRLSVYQQWKQNNLGHTRIAALVRESAPFPFTRCDLTLARFVFGKNFRVVIHSINEWLNNEVPLHDDIVCFTDGSKLGKTGSTGASIFNSTKGKDLVLPMGYTTTVFQAEVYAILMSCVL